MMEVIRVVLVDPADQSRQALQRLLGEIKAVWIAEVCTTYQGAERRVAEIGPDLTIVVADSNTEQAAALIRAIAQAKPGAVVLPASTVREGAVILQLFRAGAREFLSLPAEVKELKETLERLFEGHAKPAPSADRGPHVIALMGTTGGVGCTTLAVNIAASLAKASEHEAVLVDFDLLLGSVDSSLDIMSKQTILEVAQDVDRLDLTLLKRSLIKHSSGLYVLPRPTALEDAAKLDAETLRRVVSLLKAAFPTVVIDTSKGLQASDFVAFEMADVILMAIQLDLNSLRNTARLLQLFRQQEGMIERVRLVANRVGAHNAEISVKKAEETLKLPISWQVPNAFKSLHNARSKGVTLDVEAPGCRAHQAILEIAHALRPFPNAAVTKPRKKFFAAFF